MKMLNVTAEGFTEEAFVKDILTPHLWNFGIHVQVRKVLTNRKMKIRGGIVGYGKFKNDVTQWFKESPKAYHTTLIDLYGLSTDFPGYTDAKQMVPYSRVAKMEQSLAADLNFYRFIPYIQLHEFETLLFADPEKMEAWLGLYEDLPLNCFTGIRNKMPDANPELINDSPETAPSKRIMEHCASYNKVSDGVLLVKEIGLEKIRSTCSHFNQWLTVLESLQ